MSWLRIPLFLLVGFWVSANAFAGLVQDVGIGYFPDTLRYRIIRVATKDPCQRALTEQEAESVSEAKSEKELAEELAVLNDQLAEQGSPLPFGHFASEEDLLGTMRSHFPWAYALLFTLNGSRVDYSNNTLILGSGGGITGFNIASYRELSALLNFKVTASGQLVRPATTGNYLKRYNEYGNLAGPALIRELGIDKLSIYLGVENEIPEVPDEVPEQLARLLRDGTIDTLRLETSLNEFAPYGQGVYSMLRQLTAISKKAPLKGLKTFHLNGNFGPRPEYDAPYPFADFMKVTPNLEVLNLDRTAMFIPALHRMLEAAPILRELSLASVKVWEGSRLDTARDIGRKPPLPLDFSWVMYIDRHVELRVLNLKGAHLSVDHLKRLLARLPKLERLGVPLDQRGNPHAPEVVKALAKRWTLIP